MGDKTATLRKAEMVVARPMSPSRKYSVIDIAMPLMGSILHL